MACENCIHQKACQEWINNGEALYNDFDYSVEDCPYFTDQTEWTRLHCKPGDTVYYIDVWDDEIQSIVVGIVNITLSGGDPKFWVDSEGGNFHGYLGEQIFLTKEAAEKALAERN